MVVAVAETGWRVSGGGGGGGRKEETEEEDVEEEDDSPFFFEAALSFFCKNKQSTDSGPASVFNKERNVGRKGGEGGGEGLRRKGGGAFVLVGVDACSWRRKLTLRQQQPKSPFAS